MNTDTPQNNASAAADPAADTSGAGKRPAGPLQALQGASGQPAAPILARLNPIALDELADAPAEFMVFPAGTHTINATQYGKPITATVTITAATAAAMQTALTAHLAGPQKPYFDFNHDDNVASAWPKSFRWENGATGKRAGVYAAVEWSASGNAAVTGKDYRSFSPAFHVDASTPAHVTGAPINMGGLVNAPAFRAQAPLWAKEQSPAASPDNQQQPTHTTMTDEEKKAAAAAAQQAEAANASALKAKDTEIGALQTELAALKAKETQRRKTDAAAKVAAAVARGALPPKDDAIQAKWRGLLELDPAHAELLASLPGADITQTVTSAGHAIHAKDGAVESLRAMHAIKPGENDDARRAAAKDRSAIYAKEVAPLFKPGFALGPILAAHDLGTLAPEIIVQRAFARLVETYPCLRSITTDFSGENAAYGQTIKTRLLGSLAINDYDPDEGYGSNDAKSTDVPIVIDKHKGVPLTFNVNELASTTRDLFGEQVEAMHIAVGEAFTQDLFALITAAKFAKASAFKLADFDRTALTAIAKDMNKDKVPAIGRILLLGSDFFQALANDKTIVQLAAFQRPEYITSYTLPNIAGFQPYEVISLPAAAALAGFATNRDGLCLATRVPNDYTTALPGSSNGSVSIVTNAQTGISVQLVQYVNHDLARATMRVALMYGVAVGNPAVGRRLTLTA